MDRYGSVQREFQSLKEMYSLGNKIMARSWEQQLSEALMGEIWHPEIPSNRRVGQAVLVDSILSC